MSNLKALVPPMIHINVHSTCLLKCEFCAKSNGKYVKYPPITIDRFKECVDKYLDYGTTIFELTPPVGDTIDLDPVILKQYLDYLEENERVEGYFFYTSLVTPKNMSLGDYDFIFNRKKFLIQISLYAVNRTEFLRRTSGSTKQYHILIDNLHYIIKNINKLQLCVSDRTTYGNALGLHNKNPMNIPTSKPSVAFEHIIPALKSSPRICVSTSVDVLPDHDYKKTTCQTAKNKNKGICLDMLISTGPFPNGKVSLCSWIDSRQEMIKGDIYTEDLAEIYKDYFVGNDGEEVINKAKLGFDEKYYVCETCDYFDDGTAEGGRASESTIRDKPLDIGHSLEDKVKYIKQSFLDMMECLRTNKGWTQPTWW